MKSIHTMIFSVMFLCIGLAFSLAGVTGLPLSVAGNLTYEALTLAPTPKSQVAFQPIVALGSRAAADVAQAHTVYVNPITTQFPYMVLNVAVIDQDGNPLEGLGQEDFAIFEDAADTTAASAEPIVCFSDVDWDWGISFSLVFDVSSSMNSKQRLVDAKAAVLAFIDQCNRNDRGSLVTFSSGGTETIVSPVDWIAGSDQTGEGIADAVQNLTAAGNTAVYDGTAKGMDSLVSERSPKVVIVFSDGVSNSDKQYDINSVIARAVEEGVLIYTVSLGNESEDLKMMAEATGGEYRYAPQATDMIGIYTQAYEAIYQKTHHQYLLFYYSPDPQLDGTTRQVTVTCRSYTGSSTYQANDPPKIIFDTATQGLGTSGHPANTPVTIRGMITDVDAQSQNQSLAAKVFYRHTTATTSYEQMALTLVNNGDGTYSFEANIPAAQVYPPGLDYYVYADDGISETYSNAAYNQLPHVIPVQPNQALKIIHTPLVISSDSQVLTFNAQVLVLAEGQTIIDVGLYYRRNDPYLNQSYNYIPLTQADAGDPTRFETQIPASLVGHFGLNYFIAAVDNAGLRSYTEPSLVLGNVNATYNVYGGDQALSSGYDQVVDEGATVVLEGSDIGDSDASPTVFYRWAQLSGTPVSSLDSDQATPAFTVPPVANGSETLTFQLTRVDSRCIQTSDTVKITVNDSTPQAGFSWSPENPARGETIHLQDQSLTGYDAIVGWEWDFAGQDVSHEQNPDFTFGNSGTYPISLTVTDEDGSTQTFSRSITITAMPPIPVAGPDQNISEGETVMLSASDSSDPEAGAGLSYQWAQTTGTAVVLSDNTAVQPTFTAPLVGSGGAVLTFMLTVTNSSGLHASDTVDINVSDVAPQASFTWTPNSPVVGRPVTFQTQSVATGDAIVTYYWDFGPAGTSEEPNPTITFDESGSVDVGLRVVDAKGTTVTSIQTLQVAECDGDCRADGGCFLNSLNSHGGLPGGWVGLCLMVMLAMGCLVTVTIEKRFKLFVFIIGTVYLAYVPQMARAQDRAHTFALSILGGGHVFDQDQDIDKELIGGLGLTYNFTDQIGLELLGKAGQSTYHYYDRQLGQCREDDLNSFWLTLDGLYYFKPYKKWRPYLAAGVGARYFDYDRLENDSAAVVNYGGGLLYALNDRISLRADLRHLFEVENSYHNVAGMIGVTFQWGAKKQAPPPLPAPPVAPPKPVVKPEPMVIQKAPAQPAAPPIVIPPKVVLPEPPVQADITFGLNHSQVDSAQVAVVKQWADYLKARKDMAGILEGYTCNLGAAAYNLKLSRKRAENVKRYMVEQLGVEDSRLTVKGFGEAHPLNQNRSEAERRLNRRVSIRYVPAEPKNTATP